MWSGSKEAGICVTENDDQPELDSFRNEISIQLDAILTELQATRLAGDSDAVTELENMRDKLLNQQKNALSGQHLSPIHWLQSLWHKGK